MVTSLNRLRSRLTTDPVTCSFECASILLGSLTREMHRLKLLDSDFKAPYLGCNLLHIWSEVQQFQTPHWCTKVAYGGFTEHTCTLKSKIDQIVKEAQESLRKLTFQFFTTGKINTFDAAQFATEFWFRRWLSCLCATRYSWLSRMRCRLRPQSTIISTGYPLVVHCTAWF